MAESNVSVQKLTRKRGMGAFGSSANRPAAKLRGPDCAQEDDSQSVIGGSASQKDKTEVGSLTRSADDLDMATCARIKAESFKKKKNAGMEYEKKIFLSDLYACVLCYG